MNAFPIHPESILEGLETAVLLVDQDNCVQWLNFSAEVLLGRSRRRLIGNRLSQTIENDTAATLVQRSLEKCHTENSRITLREIALNNAERPHWVDITMGRITSERGVEPNLLVEINEINRTSRVMREKEQQERQESFRLILRGMAHEIKNPLGGIRGAAQLLESELDNPSHTELTDILIKEADRLSRLVDRVMGSRKALSLARTNIHEILEHVAGLITVNQSQQPAIHRAYDPALPEIKVDKEQLIQAVLNIAMNAIQAQSNTTNTEIGFVTRFERMFTIGNRTHRKVLRLIIWDKGPGIPADIQPRIFDPLVSGHAEGSGLGLAITQEIIQRHQGLVQLEKYRVHTAFTIYLPYLEEEKTNA